MGRDTKKLKAFTLPYATPRLRAWDMARAVNGETAKRERTVKWKETESSADYLWIRIEGQTFQIFLHCLISTARCPAC